MQGTKDSKNKSVETTAVTPVPWKPTVRKQLRYVEGCTSHRSSERELRKTKKELPENKKQTTEAIRKAPEVWTHSMWRSDSYAAKQRYGVFTRTHVRQEPRRFCWW